MDKRLPIEVISQLACAEANYVYYDDLISEIGQKPIDSLIEYNVLNLRPYFSLAKDLNPAPVVSKSVHIHSRALCNETVEQRI